MAEADVRQVIKEKLHSRRGRNMVTFFVFVIISAGLWFVMSLNDTSQRDYSVNVTVAGLPYGETFCLENGDTINADGNLGVYHVIVKERGIMQIRGRNKHNKTLEFNFTDFQHAGNGVFYLSSSKMESALQEYLGNRTVIVTWKPSIVTFKSASDLR